MKNKPLQDKTIILTGSFLSQSVMDLIHENGGKALHFPLIEVVERQSEDDLAMLQQIKHYDWLIFTSQNAVHSFIKKCDRYQLDTSIISCKIACVGEKTAMALRKNNLNVHFTPSIYSADVLIQEFHLEPNEKALFVRGSLAKSTIKDGTNADEWTVYETRTNVNFINQFKNSLQQLSMPIIVFASPSAVDVFANHLAKDIEWTSVKCASIGHVTTAALAKYEVTPYIQPKNYTLRAVIQQLILEEQKND